MQRSSLIRLSDALPRLPIKWQLLLSLTLLFHPSTASAADKPPPIAVAPFDAKVAGQHQIAWARHLKSEVEIKTGIGMKLRLIPPGEFFMGESDAKKVETRRAYRTQRRVRITKPYYLGKHEVTRAEFDKLMGTHSNDYLRKEFKRLPELESKYKGVDLNRLPVENISYVAAAEFCNKLSELDKIQPYYRVQINAIQPDGFKVTRVAVLGGPGYRLPTEAEWECACRAGTTTVFHFGNWNNGTDSNCNGEKPYPENIRKGPHLDRMTVVGSYRANPFGLHDMHGNVAELCQDLYVYDDKPFSKSLQIDPSGPKPNEVIQDHYNSVIRGGQHRDDAEATTSASRSYYWLLQIRMVVPVGFRVARGIPQPPN